MTWPWPAPVDDGGARHLHAGLALPDMELRATGGGAVDPARLAGAAVIFVYPYTGQPGRPNPPGWDDVAGAHGSTPEAEGFRDLHSQFVAMGLRVFGLSTQAIGWQEELVGRLALPFPLLSDEDFAFSDALALPWFETGGARYLKRLTLIATGGILARVYYPVHPPDRHAAEILADLSGRSAT